MIATDAEDPLPSTPNFQLVIDRQYAHSDWGFVVYRTTAYNDESKWIEFRRRWDTLIEQQLERDIDRPGVREAKQRLRFHWVEDKSLDGATTNTVSRQGCSKLVAMVWAAVVANMI